MVPATGPQSTRATISTNDSIPADLIGPDTLEQREFSTVLRGYDRDEVRRFLARAATSWRQALIPATPAGPLATEPDAAAEHAGTDEPAGAGDPVEAGDTTPADTAPAVASMPTATEPVAPVAGPANGTTAAAVVGEGTSSAAERDRATAYAQRLAAELDRASARTELAQAHQQALQVIDNAQRRADVVLQGARARARAEADATLTDARSRLAPLLEQERAVQARLERLRDDITALTTAVVAEPVAELPDAEDVVGEVEVDPATPQTSFPPGFGSVTVE